MGIHHEGDNAQSVGTKVESAVIALFSPFVFVLSTELIYYIFVCGALLGVLVIMLFRILARKADHPNWRVINRSLRWSARLMQLVFIGAVASASLHLHDLLPLLPPAALFIGLAVAVHVSFAMADELILGEYLDTWVNITREETEDNSVGKALRNIIEFERDFIRGTIKNDSEQMSGTLLKIFLLGIGLFAVFVILSAPITLILAEVFGDWGLAVFLVLATMFFRDTTRYLYINYGAASSLGDLKSKLRWEFLWTLFVGILLAGIFGYDISQVFH